MFFLRKPPKGGIDPQSVVEKAGRDEITVIDVRELGEVSMSGKAAGALHIPLMRLRDMADPRHPDFHRSLDHAKPIVVYCASGARSHHASRILEQLGYGEVHNLGGLNSWVMAGGHIERA